MTQLFKHLVFWPLTLCLALIGSQLFSQSAFDQHLEEWMADPNAKVANISPSMLSALSKLDKEELDPATKEVIGSLTGLKSLQIASADAKDLHQKAKSKLTSNGFDELLGLKEGGFDITILAKNISGNTVEELVILKSNGQTLYGSDMVGSIDLTKVKNLSGVLKTPGLEHLKNIKNK